MALKWQTQTFLLSKSLCYIQNIVHDSRRRKITNYMSHSSLILGMLFMSEPMMSNVWKQHKYLYIRWTFPLLIILSLDWKQLQINTRLLYYGLDRNYYEFPTSYAYFMQNLKEFINFTPVSKSYLYGESIYTYGAFVVCIARPNRTLLFTWYSSIDISFVFQIVNTS